MTWTMHHLALAGLRATLKVYHRFEVHGRDNLPTAPPFVMIANHASHLDALVLAAALPRRVGATTFPVAAGDVFFESAALSAATVLFINAPAVAARRRRATRWRTCVRGCSEDVKAVLVPQSLVLKRDRAARRTAGLQDSGPKDSGPKGSTRDIAPARVFLPIG